MPPSYGYLHGLRPGGWPVSWATPDAKPVKRLKGCHQAKLVQTLEHARRSLIHGGPFAILPTAAIRSRPRDTALKLGDYGDGGGASARTWARRSFGHQVPLCGLTPSAVVIVATVKALKYNGVPKE